MSKLGEILRELREKEGKRGPSSDPLFVNNKPVKGRRVLLTIVLFILFISSIFGGFFLVKIISTLKDGKDLTKLPQERGIPIVKYQASPKPQDKNMEPSPLSNKTTDIEKVNNKITEIKEEKTREPERKLKPSVKGIEKVKKTLKDQKAISFQRPFNKAFKESKPKEEISIPPKGTLEEKTPILKERKLIENLLLNAEEARERGNIEDAIIYYTAYLKYNEDPDVLNNLAGLYILRGEFKRAERLLERALSIKKDEIYEINLIISLWKQGEKEKACHYLKGKQFPSHLGGSLEELKKYCK